MQNYEQRIYDEFGYNILIAGELEFYIEPRLKRESEKETDFLAKLLFNLLKANIKPYKLDVETAPSMFEVALEKKDIATALKEIAMTKEIINLTAKQLKMNAITDIAKPYENLPGCGLHIHINITNKNDENILKRSDGEIREESPIMLNIIGGLCNTMLKNFTCFAPREESYNRFSAQLNENDYNKKLPLALHNDAPVNISWGGNNRSVAIRIPTSTLDENTRHIEHRVAGMDADPEQIIEAISQGIYLGLKEKTHPPEKIYGNAFDDQYSFLTDFPQTLKEAREVSRRFSN